jgi:hypothetical protein
MARHTTGLDTGSIDLGTSSTLNPTTAMSFSCWARASAAPGGGYRAIIKRIDAGNTHYYAFQLSGSSTYNTGLFYTDSGNTGRSLGTGNTSLIVGTWYQMGFVIPATAVAAIVYVDGSSDGVTGAAAGGVSSITANTFIGKDASSANSGWNGDIADAAIWNVALTVSEMAALAQGARPNTIRTLSLVGWWPFDGLQSLEPDLSGFANNGTLTGTSLASGPPIMQFTPRWPQGLEVISPPYFTIRKQVRLNISQTGP